MRAYGVVTDAAHEQSEALRKTGQTVMFLDDDIRELTPQTVSRPPRRKNRKWWSTRANPARG